MGVGGKSGASAAQQRPQDIEFHYIKSNLFRAIHADGAYGGVTARGYIHLSFNNERRAIPRRTILSLDAETQTSRETVIETREGVVRELEVDVLMDEVSTAELIDWLKAKLDQLRAVKKLSRELQGQKEE